MILHAIPDFALAYPDSGNWKAVHATEITLRSIGASARRFVFHGEDPGTVIGACTPDITDVIVEYSYWGWLVKRLVQARPGVRVHVRAHNPEALQHWHREAPSLTAPAHLARCTYGCLRVLWQDTLCCRYATSLLGIGPWETATYWRRLPGRAQVEHMPYFSPWPTLRPGARLLPWAERRQVILGLPGGFSGRFHRDQVIGLGKMAASYRDCAVSRPGWAFLCTRGVLTDVPVDMAQPGVEFTPVTDDVWGLLGSVRAVAVLTDLGFGIKTTVIDAVAAGCYAIVPPKLWSRLPAAAQRHCLRCVPGDARSVADVLAQAERAPDADDPNQTLRNEAANALRRVLSVVDAP
jgi:hypothetical protein